MELLEEAILLNRINIFIKQNDDVFVEIFKTSSDRWRVLIKQIQKNGKIENTYKYGIKVRDTGLEKTYVDLEPIFKKLKNVGFKLVVIHLT